jgi:hypothetical protein
MIFRFVVTKLKWLARVPLLPQVFDAALLIGVILFAREKLRAREMFENAVYAKADINLRPHRFGGIGFFAGEQEIGHLHGNGLLDLLVGRRVRDDLVAHRWAIPHHVFPNSGWISFWLDERTDVSRGLELFEAALAHRRSRT